MKKTFLFIFPFLSLLLFSNCKNSISTALPDTDILKVEKITDNSFLHISYLQTKSFGKVGCNGLVYINENEAVVFDTPIDSAASNALLDWLENEKVKTKAIVINHFHVDCLGGLEEFHKRNILSYANEETIELAKEEQVVLPENGFNGKKELKIGQEKIQLGYFGEAHTIDNIVGWIPSEKMLFGGCMLKSLGAGKGNLADANVNTWSATVAKVKSEYPDLKYAIPGHGKIGGMELLDYTIEKFPPIEKQKFVFFFHSRFLENNDLNTEHPEYGAVEYEKILSSFKKEGFNVLSEKRDGNVNAVDYAGKIKGQIDSLLLLGALPENITAIGASKGGYIAQYVSTLMANPKMNYVFIASFQEVDIEENPEIKWCGNILNIYEATDFYGVSAKRKIATSTCTIPHFKEVELNTGLKHGIVFKAMEEWVQPCVDWVKGEYE